MPTTIMAAGASTSIWTNSSFYTNQLARRARNEDPQLTCELQLADILRPLTRKGMTLLDAGCASGYYYRTLKKLGVDYYGIDSCPEYIDVGQAEMPNQGLPAKRLRCMAMEHLNGETYDVVTCFNTLLYAPNYHLVLDRLADATISHLVIRTLLGPKTQYRYEIDGHLNEGFNHLKAYFNIYSMRAVTGFLKEKGFAVSHVVDRHTGDHPEMVIGKIHPWRILVCTRTSGNPS